MFNMHENVTANEVSYRGLVLFMTCCRFLSALSTSALSATSADNRFTYLSSQTSHNALFCAVRQSAVIACTQHTYDHHRPLLYISMKHFHYFHYQEIISLTLDHLQDTVRQPQTQRPLIAELYDLSYEHYSVGKEQALFYCVLSRQFLTSAQNETLNTIWLLSGMLR